MLRCVPSLSLSWHFPPIHTHTDRQTQQTSVLSTGPSLRLVRTLPSCLPESPCRCADVWTLRLRFFRYRYECVVIPSPFALRASFAGTCPSPPLCRATHICPICSPSPSPGSQLSRSPPLSPLAVPCLPLRSRSAPAPAPASPSDQTTDKRPTRPPARSESDPKDASL